MCKISGTCKAAAAVICCTVFKTAAAIQRKWQRFLRGQKLSYQALAARQWNLRSTPAGYEHLAAVWQRWRAVGGNGVDLSRLVIQRCLDGVRCHPPLSSSQPLPPQMTPMIQSIVCHRFAFATLEYLTPAKVAEWHSAEGWWSYTHARKKRSRKPPTGEE